VAHLSVCHPPTHPPTVPPTQNTAMSQALTSISCLLLCSYSSQHGDGSRPHNAPGEPMIPHTHTTNMNPMAKYTPP